MFRFSRIFFGLILLLGSTVISSAQEKATPDWWPLCEMSGCGPYKGCPKAKPLCVEVENPCDYKGAYFPGGITDALLCCVVSVNRIERFCGKDPAEWGEFKNMCECVCRHRDTDPFLKEHAQDIICPQDKRDELLEKQGN